MGFLQQIFENARIRGTGSDDDNGAVDDFLDINDRLELPLPKTTPIGKGAKKQQPTTDAAQNSLIRTLWFYNNSDSV